MQEFDKAYRTKTQHTDIPLNVTLLWDHVGQLI